MKIDAKPSNLHTIAAAPLPAKGRGKVCRGKLGFRARQTRNQYCQTRTTDTSGLCASIIKRAQRTRAACALQLSNAHNGHERPVRFNYSNVKDQPGNGSSTDLPGNNAQPPRRRKRKKANARTST